MKNPFGKYSKRCPQCKAYYEKVWKECTACKIKLQPAIWVDLLELMRSVMWGILNSALIIVLLVTVGYNVQKDKQTHYRQAFSYLVGLDIPNAKRQVKLILNID